MTRRFENLPLGEIRRLMTDVLGPAENETEESRRTVAFVAIDCGLTVTGLEKAEVKVVRAAMEQMP
jgi:hypothetical protein